MQKRLSIFIFFLLSLLILSSAGLRHHPKKRKQHGSQNWVDSVFNQLTLEERLGQLFMVAAYSNRGEAHKNEIENLITNYHIGGLIFFQGGPVRQAKLTNHYQSISKVPLFLAMDAEWGLGMRLDSTISFPRQMALGAIQNNDLIYKMGEEMAYQCHRIGMQINFAPVVDINFNPSNPVIGTRAFGENIYNVTNKGIAYMKGMQHHHVIACAKHFPGHGDTDSDSHKTLPTITHSRERIESIELFPFKKLIEDSLRSIMVAHLHIPSLDSTKNRPTTLSPKVVNKLLKQDLKFEGLVFTDALNMKGISNYSEPGVVDAQALIAGNDILLFPEDVPKGIEQIKLAIQEKRISQSEVDNRVKKILLNKYWTGLNHLKPIVLEDLYEDLNHEHAEALNYQLYEKAITVIKNDKDYLPIKGIDNETFATVMLGDNRDGIFAEFLKKYTEFSAYSVPEDRMTKYSLDKVIKQVEDKKVVVVGLGTMNNSRSKNYGITKEQLAFLDSIQTTKKLVIVAFGNVYGMKFLEKYKNVICTYERNNMTEKIVPQVIFGAIGADGETPVTVSKTLPEGSGFKLNPIGRVGYSYPITEGLDLSKLAKIDEIAKEALDMKATPGCQVLVARNGKIVYQKNYGSLTYDGKNQVNDTTIYDIASVTKVVASTQAVMWLRNNGYIHPDDTLTLHLPELAGSNKEFMTFREIMAHQSGLFPFIPYWTKTLDSVDNKPLPYFYSAERTPTYSVSLTDKVFLNNVIEDSVWQWTIDSRLVKLKKDKKMFHYRYSDVGYYFIKRITEKITETPYDEFIYQNFYNSLGMYRTMYKPLDKFKVDNIAPTEEDTYFRNQLVHGTVHDPGAALIGGVAGHAGIFSTAEDLAKIAQMNLQKGYYGGVRYLDEEVVEEYTCQQFEDNRKGMGWDKMRPEGRGSTSEYCSFETFGHTGFTGTGFWIDPQYDLVYIFLSNRVYPDAGNTKLAKYDIRTRIHDVIYQSITSYNENLKVMNP